MSRYKISETLAAVEKLELDVLGFDSSTKKLEMQASLRVVRQKLEKLYRASHD